MFLKYHLSSSESLYTHLSRRNNSFVCPNTLSQLLSGIRTISRRLQLGMLMRRSIRKCFSYWSLNFDICVKTRPQVEQPSQYPRCGCNEITIPLAIYHNHLQICLDSIIAFENEAENVWTVRQSSRWLFSCRARVYRDRVFSPFWSRRDPSIHCWKYSSG